MKSFMQGFRAAMQLGLLLWTAALLFPLFVVGLLLGLARTGVVAGLNATDDFLDYLTGDCHAWRVRLVRTPPATEGAAND